MAVSVIHYTAAWCGPCRTLKPILQEVISENPQVSFNTIDVDANRESAIADGIRSVPVVIIKKDGVETARFVGVRSKMEYSNAIRG